MWKSWWVTYSRQKQALVVEVAIVAEGEIGVEIRAEIETIPTRVKGLKDQMMCTIWTKLHLLKKFHSRSFSMKSKRKEAIWAKRTKINGLEAIRRNRREIKSKV